MKTELSKYSVEELQKEIERRETKISDEQYETPFDKYPIFHRSVGWRPLKMTSIDKEYKKWLDRFLVQLKEITNMEWYLDSYLVTTNHDILISLPLSHDEFTIMKNDLIKKLMDIWPALSEDDFGFKLEKVEIIDFDTNIYTYRGMWTFNPINIHDRGKIYSTLFGL